MLATIGYEISLGIQILKIKEKMVDANVKPSESELDQLINTLDPRVTHFGPRSVKEIEDLSTTFFLRLPDEYNRFLQSYGALAGNEIKILGIADSDQTEFAVSNLILLHRFSYSSMPLNILPIEDLGNGCYAGLVCSEQENDPSPVVLLDLRNLENPAGETLLASGFNEYLYYRLVFLLEIPNPDRIDLEYLQHGLDILERHVRQYNDKFHYDHASGGKLPANHEWRPYRYCIQDVLFGATVTRHNRKNNCLEVDVFLTANIPEYDRLSLEHRH